MQTNAIGIALRPRPPWEAADLGLSLLRQHARAIALPWLIVSLGVGLPIALIAGLLDQVWLASLLLWWLKPMFDRLPLFVLSRAVFGSVPSLRETLHAQLHWGWRPLLPWLLWRRLSPIRGVSLVVDLLEAPARRQRSERVRLISRIGGSAPALLTVACLHLEAMLMLSLFAFAALFVPLEFLSDSTRAALDLLLESQPPWLDVLYLCAYWLAVSVLEPCYIAAGFGLYLNRRTQLEAWDIELAFRQLARRLSTVAAVLLVWAILALPQTSMAKPAKHAAGGTASTDNSLQELFGRHYRTLDTRFDRAARSALDDPMLSPRETQTRWRPRDRTRRSDDAMPLWLRPLVAALAFLIENALWVLLAIVLLLMLTQLPRWLSRTDPEPATKPSPVHDRVAQAAEALPDDIAAAAAALWQSQRARAALGLLYRGGVQRLGELLQRPLVPGATESECLRAAGKLGDHPYATLFAQIVRRWQASAYAHRDPSHADFEALLAAWRTPGVGR